MYSLSHILFLLLKYKYAVLFPVLIVEGPMTTILAAFLSSPAGGGLLNILIVFYIVVLADVVGDTMYYFIGRFGKTFIINKWWNKKGSSSDKIAQFENYYKIHGPKTLALAKITHGVGWLAMVGAGSARMPYSRFITVSSLVSIPKSILLLTLGYYYGKSYEALSQYLSTTALIITTIILLMLVVYFFKFRKRKLSNDFSKFPPSRE